MIHRTMGQVEYTNDEGKSYSLINEAEGTCYQLTFNKGTTTLTFTCTTWDTNEIDKSIYLIGMLSP